jgi:hypothetical protein
MRNVSDKSCLENQNRNFTLNDSPAKFCAIYEIMWNNVVELDRPQIYIRSCNTYFFSTTTVVA